MLIDPEVSTEVWRLFIRLNKRITNSVRRIIKGDGRQVLWDTYYMFRGLDLVYTSLESIGLSADIGSWYENSGGPDLKVVIKSFPKNTNASIIDFGCGKGGALITLSQCGFRSVDGLDISKDLLLIAKNNLRKLNIRNVKLFCSSAASFTELHKYTFIYMFNPFPPPIMNDVISNINESIEKYPREITIIYKNPVCHNVIVNNSDFRVIRKFEDFLIPFWVYKNRL